MTDYWARPGSSGQPDFEITLNGADGSFPSPKPERGDGDQPSGRPWGVIVGLTALGAIALVIAASVVIQITTDDGPKAADPASTTLELDTPAPVPIATPVPTATPETGDVGVVGDAGALGNVDIPENRYPPMPSAPSPVEQQLPSFPVIPGSASDDLTAYDLDAAVANNMPDAHPQRSMFNIVGSVPAGSVTTDTTLPPTLRATAASEPGAGRDALTIDYGGDTSHIVVDRAERAAYVLGSQDNGWRKLDPLILMGGSGTESLNELFDAFVVGPITPAALAHATITPSAGLTRIMGGGFARRFDVEVPIEYLRPYGALQFADVTESTVDSESVPRSLTFQVYVTAEQHLALVTSKFTVGPQSYVLSQFFDRRPADVRIELPSGVTVDQLPTP